MSLRLGLDVGTSSLGWALLDHDHIVDCGVRIFEMGNKVTQHGEESRRKDRTLARSARRRLQRYKLRRQQLIGLLEQHGMLPDPAEWSDSFRLYQLRAQALDQRILLSDLGRILLYFNKKRGFKSNAIVARTSKEDGVVAKGIAELKEEIKQAGFRTVGEFFFARKVEHQQGINLQKRILGHWIDRSQYREEFDLIWSQQQQHYPDILTPALYREIGDRTIFYQRKLKSQKHLINKCRFEPAKRVMPKSHPKYQEFRMWQQLANLRVTYGERVNEPLNDFEREILLEHLQRKSEVDITSSTMRKALRWTDPEWEINDVPEKLKGLDTEVKLRKALGATFYQELSDEQKERLWHTLYFFDDSEKLALIAAERMGMTADQAEAYSQISLEPDYGGVSHKAADQILPFLRKGQMYAEACASSGYHHSYKEESQSKDRVLQDEVPPPDQKQIRNPVVLKSLHQIRGLVNQIIKDYGKPEIVRIEFARQLKMPRQRREKIRLDNLNREKERKEYADFLQTKGVSVHWKDAVIDKYRLWLELGCEAENIEDFNRFNEKYRRQHEEKYRLWLECNRISPYTGKTITLSRLFSPDIEVEHILPYSKSFDNSFMNKSLCERSENMRKKNRLPREYMTDAEFLALKQRIKTLPKDKRDRFLKESIPEGFLNSQLSDTGYIAKAARDLIAQAVRDVEEVPGQATGQLRKMWRLNEFLHAPETVESSYAINKEISKNRDDHRHHLLDAIVVASTTRSMIHQMARENEFEDDGRVVRQFSIDMPFDQYREDVQDAIGKVFVSHENRRRLLSQSKNAYRHWRKNKKRPDQRIRAPRGSMHEETLYGQVLHPETGEYVFVARKSVNGLSEKEAERIIDPFIREEVKRHLSEFGKIDTTKQPLLMEKKMFGEYRYVPIRHVRLASRASTMVSLRPRNNPALFVPTGNNFCIVLYEALVKGKTKRVYRSVSFLEAVTRSQAGERYFPQTVHEDGVEYKFFMHLKADDYLVLYDEHPDEIQWDKPEWLFDRLYYVVKWAATSGQLFLFKHYLTSQDADLAPKPVKLRPNYNTLKAIKVKIDRLGRVTRF